MDECQSERALFEDNIKTFNNRTLNKIKHGIVTDGRSTFLTDISNTFKNNKTHLKIYSSKGSKIFCLFSFLFIHFINNFEELCF